MGVVRTESAPSNLYGELENTSWMNLVTSIPPNINSSATTSHNFQEIAKGNKERPPKILIVKAVCVSPQRSVK